MIRITYRYSLQAHMTASVARFWHFSWFWHLNIIKTCAASHTYAVFGHDRNLLLASPVRPSM